MEAPGSSRRIDPLNPAELKLWRKQQRERMIEARLAIPSEIRRQYSERIAATVETAIGDVAGLTVSAFWPFRGEPDLRGVLQHIVARGGRTALPVVTGKGQPMQFRAWAPGESLERGVWNIPIPPSSAEVVVPEVVIAPVVAFDSACYRLGYGGGFFDLTLSAMKNQPRALGVGYSQCALPTIYPQPYDVPLDAVVTEVGVIARQAPQAGGQAD